MSTADILAAARGAKTAAKPATKPDDATAAPEKPTAAKPGAEMTLAEKLAAARGNVPTGGEAAAAPAKAEAPAATAKPASEMTLAEKLAAARGNVPTGGETAAAPAKPKVETAAVPAAAAAKPASEMSLAEKLAAARGNTASSVATAPAVAADVDDSIAFVETEAIAAAADRAGTAPSSGAAAVDRDSMSVEDIIAWCRQHDAK